MRSAAALLFTLALVGVLLLLPRAPGEGPRTPKDDEVLEKVSPSARIATDGGTLGVEAAAAKAHELIAQSRKNGGDPRLLGQAQAVLAPWWTLESPPAQVRLLRATLRQAVHEFPAALADLDALIAEDPKDVQALLTRATVLTVLARYADAEASCKQLQPLVEPLIGAVCLAQVYGVTGHTREIIGTLGEMLASAPQSEQRGWATSVLGDLEQWSGHPDKAIAHYQSALQFDPADDYTRGALADLLLDLKRPAEAAALLKDHTVSDAHLLRYALASQDAAALEELKGRVEASRARGDSVHAREESRYALQIENDPALALKLAKANWAVQHEPADARVLLEAALAAHDKAAAAPALEWLKQTGFEDPTVRALAEKLK